MDETKITEMFENFSNIVNELSGKLDGILNAYKEAEDSYNDGVRGKEWKEKYGDKLSKYEKDLKAINGEDFDILSESRKEYETDYADMDSDEYVDTLVGNIETSIADLKAALAGGDTEEIKEAAEEVVQEVEAAEVENTEVVEEPVISEEDEFQAELDKAKEAADAEAEYKINKREE